MRFAIIVHGGAGSHSEKTESRVKAAMKKACLSATHVLVERAGSALDAVEAAIRELEDDSALNAGYGSNLTIDGTVECDAALMDSDGVFGSVGAISGIKNPITAARVILEQGRPSVPQPLGRVPPMTLAGEGARRYVLERQPSTLSWAPVLVPESEMISEEAKEEREYWMKQYQLACSNQGAAPMGDTVGAVVVLDRSIAVGVSSGGLLLKHSGRIGEAAVYGAGCWASVVEAENSGYAVACSVSGTGEQIIRGGLARELCKACNEDCEDPEGALTRVFEDRILEEQKRDAGTNLQAGAILLLSNKLGENAVVRLLVAFTTPTMAVASLSSDEPKPKVSIHRQSSNLPNRLYLSSRVLLSPSE